MDHELIDSATKQVQYVEDVNRSEENAFGQARSRPRLIQVHPSEIGRLRPHGHAH